VTYLIFPALVWAAFRFGPAGVTLATAINAGLTIGLTADEVGAFFRHAINDRTLSTQLYILIPAMTALFLSAAASERTRAAAELVEARSREGERALEERRRIARDLHDSMSQALFSSALHTRAAQKALAENGEAPPAVGDNLGAIGDLMKTAQREMRAFIFELGSDGVGDGLVTGLARHASTLSGDSDVVVEVQGPEAPLPLASAAQAQLYGIGREAMTNVVKHSGATTALVRVDLHAGHLTLEIRDDGRGFDPRASRPGHFGLESMRSRAREIDGDLEILSAPGKGTLVRVDVPYETARPPHVG
jgi:signal transduction histidine kinase